MDASSGVKLLDIQQFVAFCEKQGSFLVQQTKKVVQLFSQLCLGKYVERRDVGYLHYQQLPFDLTQKEDWKICSSSDPDILACWHSEKKILVLSYGKNGNLQAHLKEEMKDLFDISPENLYLSWGKTYKELTPYFHLDKLYLLDLSETETVICYEMRSSYFKQEELEAVIRSLSFLKIQYHKCRASSSSAVRFRECSDAVCRIVTADTQGTGFVIGNQLLMTNHHVLSSREGCRGGRAEFFYDTSEGEGIVSVEFDPDRFFITSKSPDKEGRLPLSEEKLDFTIVALKSDHRLNDVFACPIPLDKTDSIIDDERAFLIHHPLGSEKKTAIYSSTDRSHRIVRVERFHLVHTADSDPGSSGAPLLNASFKLMALNRQAMGHNAHEKAAVKIDAICTHLVSHENYWVRILGEFKPLEKAARDPLMSEIIGNPAPRPPKNFTGRKNELVQLHAACLNNPRIALTGLGGAGKTALALQYVEEHKSEYQFIHFMPSGSSALIIQGLLKLADDLKIPKVEKLEERLNMLKVNLDQITKKYLLIFDGIDQIEAFQEVEHYLPVKGQCILLTSRMPGKAGDLNFELILLESFHVEEAVEYLLKATGSKEKEKARKLSEKLGNLPLALIHASGYMQRRNIEIQTYINQLDKYGLQLFDNKRLKLRENEKTILTIWESSLKEIEKSDYGVLAKEILDFFATLEQTSITLSSLENKSKTLFPESLESDDLGSALAELCDYSMINCPRREVYNVHILVQKVIQNQLSNKNR